VSLSVKLVVVLPVATPSAYHWPETEVAPVHVPGVAVSVPPRVPVIAGATVLTASDAIVVDVNVELTPATVSVVLVAVEFELEDVWRTARVSPLTTVNGPAPHAPPFFWISLDAAPLIVAVALSLAPRPAIVMGAEVTTVLSAASFAGASVKAVGLVSFWLTTPIVSVVEWVELPSVSRMTTVCDAAAS
jgi:hypothetical protein